MEKRNTEKKKKKSNVKRIVDGIGGALFIVGSVVASVLIGNKNNNGNSNNRA